MAAETDTAEKAKREHAMCDFEERDTVELHANRGTRGRSGRPSRGLLAPFALAPTRPGLEREPPRSYARPMVPPFETLRQSVVEGDVARARELATAAVAAGGDLLAAVEQGFAAGIQRVGELWEEGEYFLPELVQGAEAMKAAMAVILPALASADARGLARGRVVLGTVKGDLHDIGKGLVGVLLAAHGFEVFDLGHDVPVERFVEKAREVDANLVAASALLTTTMAEQRRLVEAIAAAELPRRPRVLIGGAPTSRAWAEEIGAHHAENALRAVEVAESLLP